jgi:hypothetical protein
MCSVAGPAGPAIGGSSTSGFHGLFATKPVSSETSKAEPRSVGDHSSIRDSWPIAFSGYPRGPRVGCETRCPKHAASNLPAETRSRTRVSREPDGHRQRRSPGWSGLGQRHSSCLWFQMLGVEAHSSLPLIGQVVLGRFPLRSDVGFASSKLRCRTFCIPPFQQKRDADSGENESPNQNGVEVDHAHSCQQESEASDQK